VRSLPLGRGLPPQGFEITIAGVPPKVVLPSRAVTVNVTELVLPEMRDFETEHVPDALVVQVPEPLAPLLHLHDTLED
jgi:hypothetical protein